MLSLYSNPSLYFNYLDKTFEDFLSFKSTIEYYLNEDKSISFYLDVPGVDESNLTVEVKENIVHVSGERKVRNTTSSIKKSFVVNKKYNLDELKAELSNGVLIITVPEKQPAVHQPKKITIIKK